MTNSRPTHLLSSYYAPRGAHRMYALGQQIAQLYLSPNDKLIGVIGEHRKYSFRYRHNSPFGR